MGMSKKEYTMEDIYKKDRSSYVNAINKAKDYFKENKYEDAIIAYKEAIDSFNTDIVLHVLRGLNDENKEYHIVFYIEVYKLKNAYYDLALSYSLLEKHEESLEYYFKADDFIKSLSVNNESMEKYDKEAILIRYNLASTLFFLERYEESRIIFKWLNKKGFLDEPDFYAIRLSFIEKGLNFD